MNQRKRARGPRSRARGMALIEALVGILIFAFGIIGLVGLQVAMARAQGTAKYRADASQLSSQLLGLMWADRTKLEKYTTANCDGYDPCKYWLAKVANSLPAGAAEVGATQADGLVSVTVTWTTAAEGTHSHVLTTTIR